MGNSLGGKKSVKIMKTSGETLKLKTPVRAGSVLETCPPDHVLLESEAVKHYGLRAKPLEPQQELRPGRVYFLVQLPKVSGDEKRIGARRVRSGIQMGARDRLESLMLARRSSSDLSNMTPPPANLEEKNGGVRVRMRLPKAEVERLMAESKDGADVAEKIARFYMAATAGGANGGSHDDGGSVKKAVKSREKRVGFMAITDTEIHHITAAL